MTGRNDAIGHLFHPKNVVLVGASDRPGHWSQRVYDNLKRFGFAGKVFPVNPNRNDIWGTPCYPKLDALPETPDHLAIFTPAETTIKILEDGGAAGARSATVYAAGFGEGGDPDGRKRGAQLRAAIERTGIAVIGPTCMGVACGAAKFATVPDKSLQQPMPSPVAIAVQSGAMATVDQPRHQRSRAEDRLSRLLRQPARLQDFRLHRLLRHAAGAARHPLLYRGRARRRAFPRSGAARPRQRENRRGGEGRGVRNLARRGAGAYRLARRQRGGVRCRCRQRRRHPLQFVRGRHRGGRIPRPPSLATRPQHRTDVQFRRAAQPHHRGRRACRRDPRHIVECHRGIARRDPRAAEGLQSARHHPHHSGEAIHGLPRHAGRRARGRHRAGRRGPADRQQRGSPARQSPVDRRHLAARRKLSARPSPCSRRCWPARPTTAGRCASKSRTCRCCAAPSARCGSSMRWRAPPRVRSTPAHLSRRRPIRSSSAAGAPAPRRSMARPRSTRSNSKALLAEFGIPLPPERLVADARRSGGGGAGDRLPGRAQGGVGGAAAQERRRPRVPQPHGCRRRAASRRRHRGPRKLAARDARRYAGREAGRRRNRGRARRAARR